MTRRNISDSSNDADLSGLFDRLIESSREAFAGGHFSISFHALSAALHCAEKLADEERLSMVETDAAQQLTHIDLHVPEYEHSTRSAALRSHESIFLMLTRQARAHRLMAHEEHRRRLEREQRTTGGGEGVP